MKRLHRTVVLTAALGIVVSACSGGSSNEGSPEPTEMASAPNAPASTEPPKEFPFNGDCPYGSLSVDPPLDSADGAFTASPFDLDTVRMFINGSEGNGTDARFSYVLIRDEGTAIPVYAPAPLLLVKMRYKDGFEAQRTREEGDWDFTFLVSCDVQVRVNHINQPGEKLLAAYGYGTEPGTYWENGEQIDNEAKMIPATEVRFEAGELLGYTQGTPSANFDYVIGVNENSVCPWEVFEEPVRTSLLAKLGPPPGAPDDGPVPNWPCTGYGNPM